MLMMTIQIVIKNNKCNNSNINKNNNNNNNNNNSPCTVTEK